MVQESGVLVLEIVFFCFIGLLKYFTAHKLISCLVCNIHMSTSHGKAQLRLLFLCLFECSLFGELLKLLETCLIFLILFLHLVANETHILSSPDHGKRVRSRSSTGEDVGFLDWLW